MILSGDYDKALAELRSASITPRGSVDIAKSMPQAQNEKSEYEIEEKEPAQWSVFGLVQRKNLLLDATILENLRSDFPQEMPSTPVQETISMESFQHDRLIDAIFRNILTRRENFNRECWENITDLCSANFDDINARVRLQLLFLASKLDPVELARNHTTYEETLGDYVISFRDLFIKFPSDEKTQEMKKFLKKPVFQRAIRDCLLEVDLPYEKAKILELIDSIRIYVSENWSGNLRGACLFDGIFVNAGEITAICIDSPSDRRQADLITLLAHETIHFLARKLSNNYNFSSPSTGLLSGKRLDREQNDYPRKFLELGRHIELIIFGKQPDWGSSKTSGAMATRFLKSLDDSSVTLPLDLPELATRASVSYSSAGFDCVKKPRFVME